jgi:multicomponent Na+:H+ antiporter subunit A
VFGYFLLSPFVLAVLAAWFVRRFPHRSGVLAVWPALLAVFLCRELAAINPGQGRLVVLPWAPSLGLSLSFHLDGLGLLFAILIAGIGALIVLYASRYLDGHAQAGRFYASLFAFMGAMLGVVLSDNVLTLFVFWELTGFTSYLLIGFEHDRAEARAAALQALIVTGAGGLALLAAGVLLFDVTATTSLSAMVAARSSILASPCYAAIAGLILLAAFTKSAQFPFHFWLPNAMEAPTPVSAYLHSATMVKAGVYLIARMTPLVGGTAGWTTVVTIAGAATMVIGAYRAVQETDLKRILAYSTLSALGVLTMLLGVGTPDAVAAALVYLVAHAGYKGALFLVAGAVDHETGTRQITALSGLRRTMPITALAGGAAALSMAGVPLTLGFVGKDGAYESLLHANHGFPWLLTLMVLASILLGLAGLLAGVLPFVGKAPSMDAVVRSTNEAARSMNQVHEPAWPLWLPPVVLALGGLLAGMAPSMLDRPISTAATAITGASEGVSLSLWHGLTPALLMSVVTLVAVGGAYAARDGLRRRMWTPRRGAEDLYAAVLWTLDTVSRTMAPALHSASLRTYVMVIVATAFLVGDVALVSEAGRDFALPQTNATVHDVFIVFLIVAGAISAALARSTISAVLSLGVVGYGVAMTFLTFGAPDLAMTQFSVETLTVLIYVLVFRHFRELGALSSRLVRTRDTVIAIGSGIFIGGVLLSVATTETGPRLREYFAELGPTLGHGRNIVNVILVDFRAFDTLGEITVLATAALGVHGLVRFAASGRAGDDSLHLVASPIFRTAARLLMPLLLLFSVFLLLRGHNQPGGGFVGGLVAAAAFALYAIAYGVPRARHALIVRPLTLLGGGLLISLFSGLVAVLRGQPFLTASWISGPLPLGTPALFDIGVFLVVAGVVLMMIFSLAEEA